MENDMDEILLLDAVERYRNNEMGVDEKILFEELRRNNAEVDQRVVEQMLFLERIENAAKIASFKQSVSEVESELVKNGTIKVVEPCQHLLR